MEFQGTAACKVMLSLAMLSLQPLKASLYHSHHFLLIQSYTKRILIQYFEGFTFQGLLLAQGPLLLMLSRPYSILDIESESSMYKASVLIFALFLHSLSFHF